MSAINMDSLSQGITAIARAEEAEVAKGSFCHGSDAFENVASRLSRLVRASLVEAVLEVNEANSDEIETFSQEARVGLLIPSQFTSDILPPVSLDTDLW
jgi:hypothetical protein